jgi:hypothetical protein
MIVGYVILFIWLLLPMFLVARSRHTSGPRKIVWAVSTLLPFAITLTLLKIVQSLAPAESWVSEDLFSTISALLLVLVVLVGGWAVQMLHDSIYAKQS